MPGYSSVLSSASSSASSSYALSSAALSSFLDPIKISSKFPSFLFCLLLHLICLFHSHHQQYCYTFFSLILIDSSLLITRLHYSAWFFLPILILNWFSLPFISLNLTSVTFTHAGSINWSSCCAWYSWYFNPFRFFNHVFGSSLHPYF